MELLRDAAAGEDALVLENVTKSFRATLAVDDLSLAVRRGELFTILGPSGCGKSTTLRIIAGLDRPDAGDIVHRQRTIVSARRGTFVEPERRGMGMVFQAHAVWPHMTVFENVAYPLRLRHLPSPAIDERVATVLRMVGLDGFERRPATRLSGGQQQRVALARALVYEPDVLLLDEPFSSLDAGLRRQMGAELKVLQARLGVTSIYVTHDQVEALALSDRIAVMNEGRLEQQGTPRELYDRPKTPFVRDFLGRTVVLEGSVRALDSRRAAIELTKAGGVVVNVSLGATSGVRLEQRVRVAVRPEDLAVAGDMMRARGGTIEGTVETTLFAGDRIECQVRAGTERLLVYVPRGQAPEQGTRLCVCFEPDAMTVWPD